MNDLERSIWSGIQSAFNDYLEMTDWWLWHAPEYYLTVKIAQKIFRDSGHAVYMDASLKRIYRDRLSEKLPRKAGRPPAYLSKRPDLSIWYKTSNKLRAAIEIKRAYTVAPIKHDIKRLREIVGKPHGADVGYLVCYSEAKPRQSPSDALEKRFLRWADETKTSLLDMRQVGPDENRYRCSWCLLRVDDQGLRPS